MIGIGGSLTATAFTTAFSNALSARGFQATPRLRRGAHRTYFRLVDDLVLMVILETSKGRVTASWWMGATFGWGYVPDGVPFGWKLYRRVPSLLTSEERLRILGREDASAEGFDYWWEGYTREGLSALLAAIDATQSRFLAEAPRTQLRRSTYFGEWRRRVRKVQSSLEPAVVNAKVLTREELSGPWRDGAERVLLDEYRKHPVKSAIEALAEDAMLCNAYDVGDS